MLQQNPSPVIQQHLNNSQSTHKSAAQASAARLLVLLRHDFSHGEATYPSAEELNVLEPLATYTTRKPVVIDAAAHKNIQGILRFVNYFLQDPSFDSEQCTAVLKKIVALAKMGSDHWTKNIYYPEGDKEVVVDSPLGETLNLVCLATLESSAHTTSTQGKEQDTKDRVQLLFNCLLHLPSVCSGGMQHEFLFLLNGAYKQIRLIEDIDSFLHEFTARYLSELLKNNFSNPNALFQLLLPWIDSAHTEGGNYIEWLNAQKADIEPLLTKQCQEFCLNPAETRKKIGDFVQCLTDIEVPTDVHLGALYLRDILRARAQISSTHPLATHRSQALATVKEALKKCDTLDEVVTRFSDFHQALQAADELLAYLNLAMFIGDEGATLQNTMRELALLLTPYFAVSEHSPCSLPVDFAAKRHAFNTAVNAFKKAKHIDFIKDFFAILTLSDDFENQLEQSLAYLKTLKNGLVLTDEVIEIWLTQHQSDNVIDISPYEINRILLQALLVAPSDWTLVFRTALEFVVRWLLQPASRTDASSQHLRAVQATYPKQFLANLLLLTLIAGSDLRISEKNAVYQVVFGAIGDSRAHRFFSISFLVLILDKDSSDQFTSFWRVVQPHLPTLLQSVSEILSLLDRGYITPDERAQILTAVQSNLAGLIQDGEQLRNLLECECLADAQRFQIWSAVQRNLGNLIKNGEQIRILFDCEHITDDQLTQIWSVVQSNLGNLIQDDYQLLILLNCKKLSTAQRMQIWTTIQPNLARFVQGFDTNRLLYVLNRDYLTSEQRTQILTAMQPHLANLVQSIFPFQNLLSCRRLTDDQRTLILIGVQPNLANLAQYANQLEVLLFHSGPFTVAQRTLILTAVRPNLRNLVKSGYELRNLLNYESLTDTQRAQILKAIPKNIVDDYYQLEFTLRYDTFQTPASRIAARGGSTSSTLDFLGSPLASTEVYSTAAAAAAASATSNSSPSSSSSAPIAATSNSREPRKDLVQQAQSRPAPKQASQETVNWFSRLLFGAPSSSAQQPTSFFSSFSLFGKNNTQADSQQINGQNHERFKTYLRETTNARTVETDRWRHVQLGSQIGFVGMAEKRYPAIIIMGNGHQIAPGVEKWAQVQLGSQIAFVGVSADGSRKMTMMKNGHQIELHGDELVVFNVVAGGRQSVRDLSSKNQIIAQVAAHLAMPPSMDPRP